MVMSMVSVTTLNAAAPGKLASNIMHFARVLREAGLPVGPSSVLDALDAALAGTLRSREDFYWTLHSIFVKRREQRDIFEQAFQAFWQKPRALEALFQLVQAQIDRSNDKKPDKAGSRRLADALFDEMLFADKKKSKSDLIEIDASATVSAEEILRAKDFEQMSVAEQALAKAAIARMRLRQTQVKTRRFHASAAGARIDLRRTLRNSLMGGIKLPRKTVAMREPPLVVLCDISGSCSSYSRMFLQFLHALTNDRDRVAVFLFGTRLTNVTRDLKRRDVDEALARVSSSVKDWSGGTRIGTALHEFNFKWGRRVLTGGAQVLIMTDGLDREDVATLELEMQHLRRSTKRIVWLNPLLRFEGFEAVAGGIRAMMPYVDEFRPVHSLDSLTDLAATLASPRSSRHDPSLWMEKVS